MLVQYYYKKNFFFFFQQPSDRSSPAFPWLSPDTPPAFPFPLSPRLPPANDDQRESKKGAGGSKQPYEATFWIAMKGGRKYPSTAAQMSFEQMSLEQMSLEEMS